MRLIGKFLVCCEENGAYEMENGSFIRASRIFVPLLGCKERNVIELGPPQFQPQTGSPLIIRHLSPQLIFHFSSGAHRMRDVSISSQSFPGLCVTCAVISVWLTGSVVSHCPAPSDSHRLTLMMRGREALACSGGGRRQKEKKTVDVERRGRKHVYTNDKHKAHAGKRKTLQGGLKERSLCNVTWRDTRDRMQIVICRNVFSSYSVSKGAVVFVETF